MSRRLAPLLLVLLLSAAACAGDAGDAGGSQDVAVAPTGPATLAFTATTIGGEAFDGADYAGQDVMFWFWAPW